MRKNFSEQLDEYRRFSELLGEFESAVLTYSRETVNDEYMAAAREEKNKLKEKVLKAYAEAAK